MRNEGPVTTEDVYRFLVNQIESIPHLEALLLLWRSRPEAWAPEELARRLFVPPEAAREAADDLVRRQLVAANSGNYHYEADGGSRDQLVECVAEVYKHNLVAVSNLIHAKPGNAVREFARAFRFTKERN
jgi:hypothetical protein